MENAQLKILRPFGPPIARIKIPEKILDELNNYVDKIIIDKEKSKNLNWGNKLIGDVTQEIKIEQDIAKKIGWLDFLAKCSAKYVETITNQQVKQFVLLESWIVRQFENEYNPLHSHSGHISGVGYLKVPENFGETVQKNKNENFNGHLQLVHGTKMFLSPVMLNIKPKVGDFYFFPNYLMHAVYPFKNKSSERRSISFNALIDDEIYGSIGKS